PGLGIIHFLQQRSRQIGSRSDKPQPYVVVMETLDITAERTAKQTQQYANFGLRPIPVLTREREQRQPFDTPVGGCLDHAFYRAPAFAVPSRARQAATAGPAPVTGHYDCDVRGLGHAADLDRHDFLLFLLEQVIDTTNMVIGEFLDTVFTITLVVSA